MLKLKLAAAKEKEVKPEKQPAVNAFTSGGIIGQEFSGIGNNLFQTLNAINRNKYDKQLSGNDHTSANQTAADNASVMSTLNSVVGNADRSLSAFQKNNENFYTITPNKIQEITEKFASLNPTEFSKITDPVEQENYVRKKYQDFIQSDPVAVIKNSTLYDPRTYNHAGIFSLINKDLVSNKIETQNYDGTGSATDASELFKITPATAKSNRKVELNFNKARNVINKYPTAQEQMQVVAGLAENDLKTTNKIYADLKTQEEKDNKIAEVRRDAENDYIAQVFASGLKYDEKRDFQSTLAAERAKTMGAKVPAKTYTGPLTFTPKITRTAADGSEVTANYTLTLPGKVWQDEEFTIEPNMAFIPLGRFNKEDVASLGAEKYVNDAGTKTGMWVSNVGGETKIGRRVIGMPVFTTTMGDPKHPGTWFSPGDFVPDYMLENQYRLSEGDQYMKIDGYIASPEVNVQNGTDDFGNPKYIKSSTTQNFYPDRNSANDLFKAMERNIKNDKPDVFSKGVNK